MAKAPPTWKAMDSVESLEYELTIGFWSGLNPQHAKAFKKRGERREKR
jgi:hypothetical protein